MWSRGCPTPQKFSSAAQKPLGDDTSGAKASKITTAASKINTTAHSICFLQLGCFLWTVLLVLLTFLFYVFLFFCFFSIESSLSSCIFFRKPPVLCSVFFKHSNFSNVETWEKQRLLSKLSFFTLSDFQLDSLDVAVAQCLANCVECTTFLDVQHLRSI